jgi:hypothetical protein
MTAQQEQPASMLPAALWWANNGIAIFPLWWPQKGVCACPNGEQCSSPAKHPLTPTGFHDATSNPETIREWWTRWPHANIGAPTGDTFDVIDIDGGAAAWAQLTAKHGTPKHIAVAMTGRTAGGFHYYVTPGGQKTIPSGKRGLPQKIEIKGQGGYIVVPPSTHITGRTYQWVKSIDGQTHGDTDYPQWLATVNATQPQHTPPTPVTPINIDTTDKTARYGAAVLTRACELIRNTNEGGRWNTVALEAVPLAVRAIAGGCLNRADAITAIQNAATAAGLDISEINRIPHLFTHMENQGITHPIAPDDTDTNLNQWLNTLPKNDPPTAYIDAVDNERQHSSWWPRNLQAVINGDDPEPHPAYLTRQDGQNLFYPAKVNGLIGESESGKTWVALHAVMQTLTQKHTCLYLDFEDTAAGIISRLRLMGATNTHLQHLIYIGPDENLHEQATRDLGETLATHCPDLIILDGFNAAMTMLGLDLNSNTDATKFAQDLLKPLARTGACVAYVDHVPKNKDARGKGGIGAQAKRAMTTGAAITVEVLEPFGRGMTGRLRLTVDKDRPGHIRAASLYAKEAGTAILKSDNNTMTITIETVTEIDPAQAAANEKQQLRDDILKAVATYGNDGASINRLRDDVKKRDHVVREVLSELHDMGLLKYGPVRGGTPTHVLNNDL